MGLIAPQGRGGCGEAAATEVGGAAEVADDADAVEYSYIVEGAESESESAAKDSEDDSADAAEDAEDRADPTEHGADPAEHGADPAEAEGGEDEVETVEMDAYMDMTPETMMPPFIVTKTFVSAGAPLTLCYDSSQVWVRNMPSPRVELPRGVSRNGLVRLAWRPCDPDADESGVDGDLLSITFLHLATNVEWGMNAAPVFDRLVAV